ncbi:MAG: zinc ABC transporter substrate-binding protein, partial [Chloroflexi bacterium]|nr:zinc ABC transporter substrate-binding protein [Chloroflexota bacterium]
MRRSMKLLTAVLVAAAVAACGGADDTGGLTETGKGPVQVGTSLSVFADMIRQVGGDRVTVLSLIPPGADVHTFQPPPKAVQRIGDMRAMILNGAGLEANIDSVIRNNLPAQAKLVELSAGLTPIDFEQEPVGPGPAKPGEGGEVAAGGNPHFWLDLRNAKLYVARIRDALIEVDGDGRAAYTANADRYTKELDTLDAEIKAKIGAIPAAQRKLVTFHDAFPYFARAYGLDLVGYA